ncbi:alpha/beta hydrolase [Candidatus Chloroploca sp. M-50]|uniref:Alpha/beta hydrolase n=1 Tax=Candidatus Chloroploca mongolica TaxID=2528176 RepID=A0ABS4D5K6_9CHLR|nr:alpha/beta hydrolase [Candidatus Chloroploca mongolica]MBP1464705.1 alpha/beta hydrolase [Candidatus Chloroploca mongolica]
MQANVLPVDEYPLRGPVQIWDGPVFYRETIGEPAVHPPLLLLHGWGGSSRYWRPTMADLGNDRVVIAPDLPGFGESPPLKGTATAENLAEMVIAFADRMGLEQFDLNGHSFCASVAVYLAVRYPHRVRRLVLTCVSTFRSEGERRIVEQVHHILALWMALRRPWMGRVRPFYRTVASRFFYRTPSDDQILYESFIDFMKMDQRTALETASSAGDHAIHPAMASVRNATLVIGARQDTIMPPSGTPEVARLILNSRLAWIERCGHLPMIERPKVYHRVLREFLD